MKAPVLRLLSGFVMMVAAAATTHAQVLLNIDWSNLSAVKITATGNAPAFSYNNGADNPVYGGGASSFKGEDGMTFVNFLTSTSATIGDVGPGATTSNLADHSGNSIFDQFYVLNNTTQGGSLKDLNIYAATTSDNYLFVNGAAAFTGEAVFDLSGVAHADLVSLFPGLGASGSLVMWNTFSYPIGTWSVTGAAAVPEPSTYAAIFGGLALVGVALRRRQAARS